jgi:acid stress-induced BolA-like protein IbaG/YrbA
MSDCGLPEGATGEQVCAAVKAALEESITGATAVVRMGSPGHFEIEVVGAVFAGKSRLESQRLVLSSIKHLMAGQTAPVHAVDKMVTRAA